MIWNKCLELYYMELNMIHGNYSKIKLNLILNMKYQNTNFQFLNFKNIMIYGLMEWMVLYHKINMTIEMKLMLKMMMTMIYDFNYY